MLEQSDTSAGQLDLKPRRCPGRPTHEPPFSKAVRIFVPPETKIGNRGFMAAMRVRILEVLPTHEPPQGRQVLDCASPLALWLGQSGRVESARGLAQSKTLARGRKFMVPMRDRPTVEAPREPPKGFKAFTDWLVPISERLESFGNSGGRAQRFKRRSWASRNSYARPPRCEGRARQGVGCGKVLEAWSSSLEFGGGCAGRCSDAWRVTASASQASHLLGPCSTRSRPRSCGAGTKWPTRAVERA